MEGFVAAEIELLAGLSILLPISLQIKLNQFNFQWISVFTVQMQYLYTLLQYVWASCSQPPSAIVTDTPFESYVERVITFDTNSQEMHKTLPAVHDTCMWCVGVTDHYTARIPLRE